jgi:hypothetical protein
MSETGVGPCEGLSLRARLESGFIGNISTSASKGDFAIAADSSDTILLYSNLKKNDKAKKYMEVTYDLGRSD